MIPTPNIIDIAKLGNGWDLSSDTCNSVLKAHRILVQFIEKQYGIVHEVDCVQHLHCVWFNGDAKVVSAFLTTYLEESLEKSAASFVYPQIWHR